MLLLSRRHIRLEPNATTGQGTLPSPAPTSSMDTYLQPTILFTLSPIGLRWDFAHCSCSKGFPRDIVLTLPAVLTYSASRRRLSPIARRLGENQPRPGLVLWPMENRALKNQLCALPERTLEMCMSSFTPTYIVRSNQAAANASIARSAHGLSSSWSSIRNQLSTRCKAEQVA